MLIRISDTDWINPARIRQAVLTGDGHLMLFLVHELSEDSTRAKSYEFTVEPKYVAEACDKLGIECYVVIKDGEQTVFATDVRPSAIPERT